MKKWIFITLSIIHFPFSILYASTLRVASFNIRYENSSDTEAKSWTERRSELAKLIKRQNLDIFGLQEVLPKPRTYLEGKLTDWTFFGDHRNADRTSGEASPIAYRTSRFDFVCGGTFWLSETPDTPGTKSWNSSVNRICTWAILHDKTDGNDFCFANTHLDHQSKDARENGVKLILARLQEYAPNLPWILTGDFNSPENFQVAKLVRATMKDALLVTATPPQGPWSSNVGFADAPKKERPATDILANVSEAERCGNDTQYGKRIDYIYVSKDVEVKDFTTVNELRDETGYHYSDHFPVVATVLLHASGTVWFADEIEKGTNFTSVTTSFSAYVSDFCAQSMAKATLTLCGEDGRRETREHILLRNSEPWGIWNETFENLTRGDYYVLTVRLEIGDFAVMRERVFRTANETEVFFAPAMSAYHGNFRPIVEQMVEDENVDVIFHGMPCPCSTLEELPNGIAKAGIAFLENGEELECVVWDSVGWRRTGQTVPCDTPLSMLITYQRETGNISYRLRTDGEGWREWKMENEKSKMENGDVASDERLVRIEISGCGEIEEVSGRVSDPRLIADADGKKYDDLNTALAAGASEPLAPLWKTCATLTTDCIGSLLVLDASQWLTFGGGLNLLRRESVDGASRVYYGRVSATDAATNRYLKAAAALGLSRLLTETSEVRIGDLFGPDSSGCIGFRVGIDGEGVTSEKIAHYLRVSESCEVSPDAWSAPPAEAIEVTDGRVVVTPRPTTRSGFVKLVIPTDDELKMEN